MVPQEHLLPRWRNALPQHPPSGPSTDNGPPLGSALQAGLTHHGCPVVCKPNRQAFEIALRMAGSPEASATLWVDDSARNITTGHRLGLYSVLVGRTGGCGQGGAAGWGAACSKRSCW